MLRFMQREIEWIKLALKRDPTKTRTGLADALGIHKSSVSKMLNNGGRRLKYEEALLAAEYLGVSPGALEEFGFAEELAPFTGLPQSDSIQPFTPLYASSALADGVWSVDMVTPIERRAQSAQFAGAGKVFGFYAPDDAMAPRFFSGETVWVNPERPAALGQDALLMRKTNHQEAVNIFLCRLEEKSAEMLTGYQFGSRESLNFPTQEWRAVHVFGRE